MSCAFRVGSGQVRYRLGERLVDRYLEFVAGRFRPNALRAVVFDLKAFFAVTGLEHATCHQLRHTCLTRLREAGMALEAVQAQAGHRSIESTRVYLHLANDWLADQYLRAAELIDADTAAVAEMLAVQEVAAR